MRIGLLMLLTSVVAARGDDGLPAEAAELATATAERLANAGLTEVALVPVTWEDGRAVLAASGVLRELTTALAKKSIAVKATAAAKLTGTLTKVKDKKTGLLAFDWSAELTIDGKSEPLPTRRVFGEEAIARLAPRPGVVVVPPATPERLRPLVLIDPPGLPPIQPPPPPVPPATEFPIKMRLLAVVGDKWLDVPTADGRTKLAHCSVFVIELKNEDPTTEFSVPLSIDGEPWDAYAEDGRVGRLIVLPPKTTEIVRGFYRTPTSSAQFRVQRLPSASRAKNPKAVGQITAVALPSWKKGSSVPAGEEKAVAHRSVLITVPGGKVADKFVSEERQTGKLRGTVTIFYEE